MQKLKIDLGHISGGLSIELHPTIPNTIFDVSDAVEHSEAQYQIVEGCFYQYRLSKNFFFEGSEIIEVSNFNSSEGRISPNFYVGTLSIPIFKKVSNSNSQVGFLELEVQSIKTSYRTDYRFMLESITKHAADLILQSNSHVNQSLDIDYNESSKTLYQRFCFVKSVIDTEDFDIAVQQILQSPVTNWRIKNEERDIRSLKKLKNKDVRNIIHSKNRISLPKNHRLRSRNIESVACKIPTSIKEESVDTPENRFIKFVLESFLFFCEEIKYRSRVKSRLHKESQQVSNKLISYLQHNLFKDVSRPSTVKINSPVLQKKSGYREVLKAWLMFDLAAKLTWEGGEDVYSGGKKHVAKLYEYWLFFELLKAIKQTFNINSYEYKKLIASSADNLSLMLKEGKQIALEGTYNSKQRDLSILFTYNKTFGSNTILDTEGSWSLQMRPDYTLSIWPKELNKSLAEKEQQIVHIHFDSKYKVKNKADNTNFKNDDIIKMHAYKDAIRRTAGAYILYPGLDKNPTNYKGFHEILPGLGAFAIRPSEGDSGIEYFINFIIEVKDHFLNRATQRENISSKTYQITKNLPSKRLDEPIPEYFDNKKLIPDETFVLVGFYKSQEHYNFIQKGFYNFRMDSARGSLVLDSKTVSAKFLLLHTYNDDFSGEFWKIVSKGPKVYSKERLKQKGYPDPRQDYYLVVEIEKVNDIEFENVKWNFKDLKNFENNRKSGYPFTCSLSELMNTKVK